MNKDAILATVIGFVVGLCLTVLIVFGPRILSKITVINLPKISFAFLSVGNPLKKLPSGKSKTQAGKISDGAFTISSPQADALVSDAEISISGTGKAGQYIIVSNSEADNSVLIQENNQYIIPVKLKEGRNDLKIYMTDFTGLESKEISVYYTDRKIN